MMMELEQAREQFAHHLQRALTGLYDPVVLGNSSLAWLLGIEEQRDVVASLRRVLTDAIESLKPNEATPLGSRGWRVYQVLRRRYTEQLTQHEVAADLGLSIRQLQREEKVAREVLAGRLWTAHNLAAKAHLLAALVSPGTHRDVAGDERGDERGDVQSSPALSALEELESLSRSTTAQVIQLRDVIQDVLDTLRPLLAALSTSATFEETDGLPPVFIKLPMLRQALLNIASVVIQCAPGGQLRVRAHHQGQRLFVDFQAAPASEATTFVQATFGETLEMAGQLLAFCQGSLRANVPGVGKPASAESLLPAAAAVTVEVELEAVEVFTVLVIEDNDDTRQLLQRYLHGTPYLFVGAPDAQQALVLAQKMLPRAIVLDVMMPGQDGWTLLGQLREHPSLRGVPIIVSTILPQKDLAFALGAAEFIRKPIKRSELLAALARHLGSQTESESSR